MTERLVIWVVFILGIALFSCDTREPGCLDITAENYDPQAINECDSCCLAPAISLRVNNFYIENQDTFSFAFNRLMPYVGTDSIVINSLTLPFSDFRFHSDGETYLSIDTIRRRTPRVIDDFITLTSTSRSQPLGRSDFVTNLDGYSMRVGLDENEVNALMPFATISSDARFLDVMDDMYVDSTSTLVQARMRLTIKDSTRVLDILEIADPLITIETDTEITLGFPWVVSFDMNLRQMIEGINADDTNEVMAETIGRNISASIRKE